MPYTIDATSPFTYTITILPAVRTFTMSEFYGVEIEDTLGEIPSAKFKLLTAKVTDEALFVEDTPIRIEYNGVPRFDGIVSHILRREDAPIWEIEAEGGLALLRDEEILTVQEWVDTPAQTIIADLLPNANWIYEPIPTMARTDYKSEHSSVLEAVRTLTKAAGFEIYSSYADGYFRLYATQQRGVTIDKTFRIHRDLYDVQREKDRVRDPTIAVVPGATADTQDTSATIALFSLATTFSTVDEPWLTASIDETVTTIPASWTDDITDGESAGVFGIGTERIAFTGRTATALTGCTRGYQGTTAAPHDAYEGILRVKSMPVLSTEGFPATGAIWMGVEKIRYSSRSATAFIGLSREQPLISGGTVLTPQYGHRAGILVVNGEGESTTWSVDQPEPGSPVALLGRRSVRVDGTGLNDQNALDMAAQRLLLNKAGPLEGGTCKLLGTSFGRPVALGDQLTIEEADGSASALYRITSLAFSMSSKDITIKLGSPRDLFTESLSKYNRNINRADSRTPLGDVGTVLQISNDEKTMLVERADGSTVWVKCGIRT